MAKKNITLRKQFLYRILIILLIISMISSVTQLYFINKQIDYEIDTQSAIISQSINQGIQETDLAQKSIEHQIDLKLFGIAKHIGDLLNEKMAGDISNEELSGIKEKLGLAGLSIFARKNNDIIALKSTDPEEIGFSTRSLGEEIYGTNDKILKGENPQVPGALSENGFVVLPIVQSGSHKENPLFFKYAYFHPDGTDYIVNPYIKADEIYQFTSSIGPDALIKEMKKENSFVKDISILDPKVFKNPKLENNFWPPVKKVVYGDYQYKSKKDLKVMTKMVDQPEKYSFVEKQKSQKVLKLFLPMKNGKVIYIVLDYQKMTNPLYLHFMILVVTGLVSLVSLFLLTMRLFSTIYVNIQRILNQIRLLESGDLTAKSNIKDGSELSFLSENVNSMADKLNYLVKGTKEHASNTQKLSVVLEEEASKSIEKIYEISTETTMQAREQLYEIEEFLDYMEQYLPPHNHTVEVQKILENISAMREIANDRTAATTNTTITLSDLLQSLYGQSRELSDTSGTLLEQISKFKL